MTCSVSRLENLTLPIQGRGTKEWTASGRSPPLVGSLRVLQRRNFCGASRVNVAGTLVVEGEMRYTAGKVDTVGPRGTILDLMMNSLLHTDLHLSGMMESAKYKW